MTSAHFGMLYVHQTYTAKVWVVISTIRQSKANRWIETGSHFLVLFSAAYRVWVVGLRVWLVWLSSLLHCLWSLHDGAKLCWVLSIIGIISVIRIIIHIALITPITLILFAPTKQKRLPHKWQPIKNSIFTKMINPRQCLCKPSTTYPVHRQEPARTMRTALCM